MGERVRGRGGSREGDRWKAASLADGEEGSKGRGRGPAQRAGSNEDTRASGKEEVAGFTLGATSRLSLARRGTWKEGAHLASASASSRGWGKRVNSRRARPDHENGRR